MAFIPDDALDRYGELQPASQLGYSFVCRHRYHETGIAPKSLDECAAKYGWSRATKYNVQKELTEKGWTEKTETGLRPLVGDFSPVDKSKKLDKQSKQQSKNLDGKSKKLDKQSKNLDSHIRNNQPLPELNQQEDVSNETLSSQSLDASLSAQARLVFAFWQAELDHTQAKFTNERRLKVIARLKEGYSVEQIKKAIKGCKVSEFHQGGNDAGTVFDDLELICRKGVKVENFIKIYEANQNGTNKPNGGKYPPKRTDADNLTESADFYRDWEAKESAHFPN